MSDPLIDDVIRNFLMNMGAEEQQQFLAELEPGEPKVTFRGALDLDGEKETAMCEWALSRMEEIDQQTERTQNKEAGPAQGSKADLNTFFGRRRLFELLYHKRVEWRRSWSELFRESNLHFPITRRYVQQLIARLQNYFFETEPWFDAGAQGEGPRDAETAKRVNRYAQWKFRHCKVRPVFETAIENACLRGESVVKVTHRREVRHYEDILPVAVLTPELVKAGLKGELGEPLVASDGDYIQKDDLWTPETDPETGQPILSAEGTPVNMVFQRDPSIVMSSEAVQGLKFETKKVLRERVVFHGPEAKNVYYLDFLCPEEAESIQKADLVAHLYDMPAVDLASTYIEYDGEEQEKNRILRLLRESIGTTNSERPAADEHRAADGGDVPTTEEGVSRRAGMISVAEIYFRRDVNGDGREEEVMLLIDRETRKPIFYDYVDRVTEKGERPFYAVRPVRVDGRWYGVSLVDMFWDLQQFIDLTINRWNFSQSQAGRLDCIDPSAVYEGDGAKHFQINTKKKYRLKPDRTIDEFYQTKYLSDIKGQDLQNQAEFFIQMASNMSGAMNANDANAAGLDTSRLATGIRNIEKSGQEQTAPMISALEDGISDAATQLLRVLGATMDDEEVFEFFDGTAPELASVMRSDIARFDWVVELQLTRWKSEQVLQQALHSIDVLERFYATPPELQMVVSPLYVQLLKLFSVPNADRMLVPGQHYLPPPAKGGPNPEQASPAVTPKPRQGEPNL